MYKQLTIFDWMPTACQTVSAYPDINDISEADAVKLVGDAIGMTFTFNERFECWMAERKKLRLSMEYGHFILDDNHDLFLGTGYSYGTSGGGAPCSGIEDAIDWFRKRMEEVHGDEAGH